ncbi:recombinase family protein [Saccharothrix texasensis]|uniref:DNA invertase Pin-like site-specific DNA recombinase n=1 Tax=Saccharothrix texasensis TaxID=103734 RepID=A0A3N1HE17_9PSEU|nr:recombinase family protein [Saccharothrix texasensis]ROP40703.1 DNA invertase Pin-like site-specific DNA recombinase [Saccharothrix texasensis]
MTDQHSTSDLVQDLLRRHRERLALIPERGEVQGGVYLRISEDREGDELGIDRHFEDLLSLFKARAWALDRRHVFIDNDLSAAGKRDRPNFLRMLGVIGQGELKVITAWMLDRFLRDRPDQLRLYELCEEREMLLSFARGSDIDMATPAGQMVADILAAVARGEIKVKGDRQRRAQEQAAQQGRRVGGRRPFGYDASGMVIEPQEAEAVRRAYSDLLAGVPLGQIAREWNAAGLRSGQTRWRDGPKGKRGEPSEWSHDTVRLVLRNPRNAGLRRYKGEIVAAARWPAIVGEEVWQAADALLGDPGRRSGGAGRAGQRMLTGVALCGVCGATVHSGRGEAARRGYPVYRCSQSTGHVVRQLGPVDEYVSAFAVARLSRPDAADLLTTRTGPDVTELRDEANALRARLDALAVEFADGSLTQSQLRAATERLRTRLKDTESQLADAGRASLLGPLLAAEDVAAAWEALDDHRRRAIVDAIMYVVVFPVGRGRRNFDPDTVLVLPRIES